MGHSKVVANELQSVGFIAKQINHNTVEVSLKNRKIGLVEVEIALDKLFGEIQFGFSYRTSSILVSW